MSDLTLIEIYEIKFQQVQPGLEQQLLGIPLVAEEP